MANPQRRRPAPPIFINPLEEYYPSQLRALEARTRERRFESALLEIREANSTLDDAVGELVQAAEDALAQDPSNPDVKAILKAAQRFQAAAQEADERVLGTDDDEPADDQDDEDDPNGDEGDEGQQLESNRSRAKIKLNCLR